MFGRPAALALPGSFIEMKNLGPHSRPTQSKYAFLTRSTPGWCAKSETHCSRTLALVLGAHQNSPGEH